MTIIFRRPWAILLVVVGVFIALQLQAGAQDSWNIEQVGFYEGNFMDVVVRDNYAYCTSGSEFVVLDVSNPSSPVRVASLTLPERAARLTLAGNLAYVADGYAGMRVIDISDPANPQEVGFYDTPGFAREVFISGSRAYVADGRMGVTGTGMVIVLDVSEPSAPFPLGWYEANALAAGVFVRDSLAFVAYGGWGLQILDFSNPANPFLVGQYIDFNGLANSVSVSENLAYMTDGVWGELHIVDISEPSSPSRVGLYTLPGNALDAFVSGSIAYVAASYAGMRVLDVSNPAAPREVAYYDTPGRSFNVFVAEPLIYLADESGLWILRLTGTRGYSVSGTVTLQDFAGAVESIPVQVWLLQYGLLVRTETLSLDPSGRFTLADVPPGIYSLTFKASHWLSAVVRDVVVADSDVTGVDVSLVNGDIDGDNEVSLFDFGQLVAAFGSVPEDVNWNPNADLDGDEEVTLFDFGILVRNFGMMGSW